MPCTLFWEPMIHAITPPTPFLNQHLIRHLLSPLSRTRVPGIERLINSTKGQHRVRNNRRRNKVANPVAHQIGFVFNQPGNSFSPFWTFALSLEVYYQIWTVTSWFSAKGMQCHRSFLVLLFPKLHSSPLAHWVTRPGFSSVPILRLLLRPSETFVRPWLRFFLKTKFFETETFLETTIFETDTFFRPIPVQNS